MLSLASAAENTGKMIDKIIDFLIRPNSLSTWIHKTDS